MNIYRFVPDARATRPMACSSLDRFWPDGIDLGPAAARLFPKLGAWWLAGNRYVSRVEDRGRPIGDVVATTQNIIVVRGRALELAPDAQRVPVTVDGEPAFALQLPHVVNAFDVERSVAVRADNGAPLFWTELMFHADAAYPDLFWLADTTGMPYVYATQRLIDRARALHVTGLGARELVWNGAPVPLAYPKIDDRDDLARLGYRYQHESDFVHARGSMCDLVGQDIHPVIERALADGRFPARY